MTYEANPSTSGIDQVLCGHKTCAPIIDAHQIEHAALRIIDDVTIQQYDRDFGRGEEVGDG